MDTAIEAIWRNWLSSIGHVVKTEVTRDFRLEEKYFDQVTSYITFRAQVQGQALQVTASVVPGQTPFLFARPLG